MNSEDIDSDVWREKQRVDCTLKSVLLMHSKTSAGVLDCGRHQEATEGSRVRSGFKEEKSIKINIMHGGMGGAREMKDLAVWLVDNEWKRNTNQPQPHIAPTTVLRTQWEGEVHWSFPAVVKIKNKAPCEASMVESHLWVTQISKRLETISELSEIKACNS